MDTTESDAAACGSYPAPGCSAPNCQICNRPFEYGDIMIGQNDGVEFCYYCAARAVRLFETLDCIIGRVTPCAAGWDVELAPSGCLIRDRDDFATWITVRRDEHDEPKVGDFITVTVPKVVAIHSQPNPKVLVEPPLGGDSVDGVVGIPNQEKQ